jgi:alpha-N-arabinofuranosidase
MKHTITIISALLFCFFLQGQNTFTNPIIPGGYPDPSICRVGDDFYIVNSSFEYFPGLPIHHSKDLVNWKLIGNGLHRPSQASSDVNLVTVQENGGIHAPTIRYNDGTFYIITTNMHNEIPNTNFIITAKDPAGPWSEPYVIENAPGIDPDLFFDDNGRVYFVGTHQPGDMNKSGIGAIWVQELDLDNWKLVGDRYSLWDGGCDKKHTEGPHIYKVNGIYYLLVAEGGTGHNHAVMMAYSKDVFGPYLPSLRNPVLTSRHLSKYNWVHSTGHADLVELEDGRWFMVALGKRNDVDGHSNMGRETHLIPIIWEEQISHWEQVSETKWEPRYVDFPVAAPLTGKVERINPLPFEDKNQFYNNDLIENFDANELSPDWIYRRVPMPNSYSLSSNKGSLRLFLKPESFSMKGRYNVIGFTQKESDFEFEAKMNFNPKKHLEEAGISVYQKDLNHINLTVQRIDKQNYIKLTVSEKRDNNPNLSSVNILGSDVKAYKSKVLENYKGEILLKITSKNNKYLYHFSIDGGHSYEKLGETPDNILLGMMYTGANVGIYATSNGQKTNSYADFDWVKYSGFERN